MTPPPKAPSAVNPFDELYDYIEARQRELDRNRIEGVQYAVLVRGAIETAMKRHSAAAASRAVADAVKAERMEIFEFARSALANEDLGWGESFDLVMTFVSGQRSKP